MALRCFPDFNSSNVFVLLLNVTCSVKRNFSFPRLLRIEELIRKVN